MILCLVNLSDDVFDFSVTIAICLPRDLFNAKILLVVFIPLVPFFEKIFISAIGLFARFDKFFQLRTKRTFETYKDIKDNDQFAFCFV